MKSDLWYLANFKESFFWYATSISEYSVRVGKLLSQYGMLTPFTLGIGLYISVGSRGEGVVPPPRFSIVAWVKPSSQGHYVFSFKFCED